MALWKEQTKEKDARPSDGEFPQAVRSDAPKEMASFLSATASHAHAAPRPLKQPPRNESRNESRNDNETRIDPATKDVRETVEVKETTISAGITIEGKVQGDGHVRIAGNFQGDVNVGGNLIIEAGARLVGSVRAKSVVIGGELIGNIETATRVELLETGILNGDLKAISLVVAAGSQMKGCVEFGGPDNSTGA
jgi:cytoskeletal protein CcmA (bactofilin family)